MLKFLRRLSLGAAAALSLSSWLPSQEAAAQSFVYVSSGGVYQDFQRKVLLEPIAKQLGIKIEEATLSSEADVRLQVRSGAVTWDIVELGNQRCEAAAAEGLLEKIDYSILDVSDFPKGTYSDYCVGSTTFAFVMAWNAKKFGKDGPKSWADFWDVKKFPGTRALWKYPSYVLEAALLADGVTADKIYPMDLDRAFKSLEKIKPHVKIWWDSGAQSAQLIKDGEVDLIGMWDPRVRAVMKADPNIQLSYNQSVITSAAWGIVKGAKNKATAMKFLAEATKPEYQAKLAVASGYGPVNKKAFDVGIIGKDVADALAVSPENSKTSVWLNPIWWRENSIKASERMDNFITKR